MSRSYSQIRGVILSVLAVVLFLVAGCAPVKPVRVAAVALTIQDVAKAAAKQSDPLIIREGTPAYLMLLDGLIEVYPKNHELLTAGCQAYATYASSFWEDEERERSALLYRKAKTYGFRALSNKVDFAAAASGSLDDFTAFLGHYNKGDVPALFWTANAWASWISSNIGSVEAMADVPFLEATIRRVLELDGAYYYGGPHLLMGIFLAAKPAVIGGDPARAKQHFDRAFSHGAERVLMARVYYAEYYARAVRDKELFQRTLRDVGTAPVDDPPEMTYGNVLAKAKAKRLLEKTEEYFGEPL